MKTKSDHHKNISLKVGLWVAAVLISWFLLMRLLGLAQIMELRLFNFIILLAGVHRAMKLHAQMTDAHYNYFETLGIGCKTVLISVGIFALFIFIYLNLDPAMMEIIKQKSIMGNFLNPEYAAIGVAIEGTSSGMIMAYVLLSYFSKPSHET